MSNAGDHAGGGEARSEVPSNSVAERDELRIDLATVLDGRAAVDLRDVLSKAISSNRPVRVNAGPVEQISTGCIQLLLAGARSAAKIGGTFIVSDQSDAFKAAFDDLGLNSLRKDWAN